ncbi:conserved Plasmodium protein, unknown function [Plasmodium knowlesi strain H]|uniref:ELM2 domain-containing protein n=3 Tax=Plasmodium knowlesi TaxID=5850 RepID=A0A5K1UGY0_PLAKH|nr:EELM2 domain-containing protein, putative [Plasmodium knowlesi strain H]OTN66932.1 Uncharacterized protein PKNOH_S07451200 [Plasmodium knowlesi]CAA9988639.1 EELM2 domain-containing protein, putative [Plasmodium knowlesi strain H]SBO21496.1 conserved Plasmodium protein, unknown function [Plasmodium knowlesi strain H]SBO21913.1 conserved Plasmodium protein, unknown function [Plasmodium knowlesi strain H]VVS78113.1 EELM2 domain-containing protein, putative [Plasmodium knowlesi strain H]|eukprot:XP_002259615.1 hypothetical protein, conserved in Plasmodium species [Plasmodium knowlesi strain H]
MVFYISSKGNQINDYIITRSVSSRGDYINGVKKDDSKYRRSEGNGFVIGNGLSVRNGGNLRSDTHPGKGIPTEKGTSHPGNCIDVGINHTDIEHNFFNFKNGIKNSVDFGLFIKLKDINSLSNDNIHEINELLKKEKQKDLEKERGKRPSAESKDSNSWNKRGYQETDNEEEEVEQEQHKTKPPGESRELLLKYNHQLQEENKKQKQKKQIRQQGQQRQQTGEEDQEESIYVRKYNKRRERKIEPCIEWSDSRGGSSAPYDNSTTRGSSGARDTQSVIDDSNRRGSSGQRESGNSRENLGLRESSCMRNIDYSLWNKTGERTRNLELTKTGITTEKEKRKYNKMNNNTDVLVNTGGNNTCAVRSGGNIRGAGSMRGSSVRGSGMRGSGMRGSGMRGSGIRSSSIRSNTARGSSVRSNNGRGGGIKNGNNANHRGNNNEYYSTYNYRYAYEDGRQREQLIGEENNNVKKQYNNVVNEFDHIEILNNMSNDEKNEQIEEQIKELEEMEELDVLERHRDGRLNEDSLQTVKKDEEKFKTIERGNVATSVTMSQTGGVVDRTRLTNHESDYYDQYGEHNLLKHAHANYHHMNQDRSKDQMEGINELSRAQLCQGESENANGEDSKRFINANAFKMAYECNNSVDNMEGVNNGHISNDPNSSNTYNDAANGTTNIKGGRVLRNLHKNNLLVDEREGVSRASKKYAVEMGGENNVVVHRKRRRKNLDDSNRYAENEGINGIIAGGTDRHDFTNIKSESTHEGMTTPPNDTGSAEVNHINSAFGVSPNDSNGGVKQDGGGNQEQGTTNRFRVNRYERINDHSSRRGRGAYMARNAMSGVSKFRGGSPSMADGNYKPEEGNSKECESYNGQSNKEYETYNENSSGQNNHSTGAQGMVGTNLEQTDDGRNGLNNSTHKSKISVRTGQATTFGHTRGGIKMKGHRHKKKGRALHRLHANMNIIKGMNKSSESKFSHSANATMPHSQNLDKKDFFTNENNEDHVVHDKVRSSPGSHFHGHSNAKEHYGDNENDYMNNENSSHNYGARYNGDYFEKENHTEHKKRKKRVTEEGSKDSGKINVGNKHQVPKLPNFFLCRSELMYRNYETVEETNNDQVCLTCSGLPCHCRVGEATLVYSPLMLERVREKCLKNRGYHKCIKNEIELSAYVQECAKSWKSNIDEWVPFSPEYAYKLLHYANYDPHKAISIMKSSEFSFRKIMDPPTRKYQNKWKPKDKREHMSKNPFPSPLTIRTYLSKRHHISGYHLR